MHKEGTRRTLQYGPELTCGVDQSVSTYLATNHRISTRPACSTLVSAESESMLPYGYMTAGPCRRLAVRTFRLWRSAAGADGAGPARSGLQRAGSRQAVRRCSR